ncbi:MAG: amino acid racemase [Rhizobiales bacterium]|nr:amino acid racemase [Hyphomicrobiales bacterium]
MRTIGIIGGMSAHSTVLYYERLVAETRRRLGGLHSPRVLIHSLDFAPIAEMQAAGRWNEAGALLAEVAVGLERAGAEIVLLATNTMHRVAGRIEARLGVPFLHIADATAERILAAGHRRPGLMATRFTMTEDFYTGRLARHGLDVVLPSAADRERIHTIIYDELCQGVVAPASRLEFEAIASRLAAAGADSLILGCTEVGMLLGGGNVGVPVFDTTLVHADAALDLALAEADARWNRGATGTHG